MLGMARCLATCTEIAGFDAGFDKGTDAREPIIACEQFIGLGDTEMTSEGRVVMLLE